MHFLGVANHSAEKCFKRTRNEKEKYHAAGDLDKQQTERKLANVSDADMKIT